MVRASISTLFLVLVGLPFTLRLATWASRLAAAFLGGIVIVVIALSVVGAAGFQYSAGTLALPAIGWLLAAAVAIRRSWDSIRSASLGLPELGWLAWLLLALAAFDVATAAINAVRVPITDTDVVRIWLPKAEGISAHGFGGLSNRAIYPDYPPLWPMHMFLAKRFGAGVAGLKLLPTAYVVSALVLVFEYLRSRVHPALAAACVLAISGVPYLWQPYGLNDLMSEVPMLAFVTASTLMLAEYVDRRSLQTLSLCVVFGIGTILVRPEGFIHAAILGAVLVLVGIRRRVIAETVIAVGFLLAAYVGWQLVLRMIFHARGGLRPNLAALGLANDWNTLLEIIRYAAANVGNPYLFGPALIATACVVLGIRGWRLFGVVATVLVLDVAAGVATYVSLPSTDVGEPLIWWLTTGFKRMLMHFIPLLYIAAALALASALNLVARVGQQALEAMHPGRWERAILSPLLITAATAAVVLVAGYAAYQVGGPKSFVLSEMYPNQVTGPAEVQYPTPDVLSVTTDSTTPEAVIYYLPSAGRRMPPLDNITGRFTRFSSSVEAQGPSSSRQHFTASVDGIPIAEATVVAGSGPVAISGPIPPGARLLELSVRQLDPAPATASWLQPSVSRSSAWWLVEAFLLLALALVILLGLTGAGIVKLNDARVLGGLGPGIASALLAAALVQQLEATLAVALPTWSFAIRLLGLKG